MRELSIARRLDPPESASLHTSPHAPSSARGLTPGLSSCEHRTVARDGRIVCNKIVEGDNEVAPHICRACPLKAVNCAHLRFSLKLTSPARLVVRFNGREEIWDDDPSQLLFERAACAARVMPIDHARTCAGCSVRQPLQTFGRESAERLAGRVNQRAATGGKVVRFRSHEVAAATG